MKKSISNNNISASKIFKIKGMLCILFIVTGAPVFAATINTTSITAFQTAINNATSGDIITLSNGVYANATITITKSGITVKALNLGGVTLTGSTTLVITGNTNTITGFQFTNGSIGGSANLIEVRGNYNILSHCNFYNYMSHNYIHFNTGYHHNILTYCNLESKPPIVTTTDTTGGNAGPSIQINTSASVISYTNINHCSFMNFSGDGGDYGNEPLRIGLSTEGTNTSGCVVEYCYFENTGGGDSETISVKSRYNILRYNTQNSNPTSCFVFRHGANNTAYANFFINSGGIRIKEGQNHMVFNNYFQGAGTENSLNLMNYNVDPISTVFIYHNTFYNPGTIALGGSGSNPPTNVRFVNNIFYDTSGTILSDINSNVSFVKNIYNGGASLGKTVVASEFTNANPNLALNSYNYYSLQASSSAAFTANGTYTSIIDNPYLDDDATLSLDIEGQTRPTDATSKNIGCDQFTTGTIMNHPLTRSEVGPSYLSSLSSQTITFAALPTKSFGATDFTPTASSSAGLPIVFTSSDPSVATIVNNAVHIVGAGSVSINATQEGDATRLPAVAVNTLTVEKAAQTITFSALPTKIFLDADFPPSVSTTAGLIVTLESSNLAVATIVNNQIHIVGAGTCIITASQIGNSNYNTAVSKTQSLTVSKANQTITFGALSSKMIGQDDFNPGASTSSGLTVAYSSSNETVATIVNNQIHILNSGTTVITAAQTGNANFFPASSVNQVEVISCRCNR